MDNLFDNPLLHLAQLDDDIARLREVVAERRAVILTAQRSVQITDYDEEAFSRFVAKPYLLRPIRGDRYELIIPAFVNFSAGWPVKTDGEFVIYEVSRFIDLITPLPAWLRNELGYSLPEFSAHIEDNELVIDGGDAGRAWDSFKEKRFTSRRGNRFKMNPRSRFDVLRDLVRMGILPYKPQAIAKELIRAGYEKIKLRPKQERDYRLFLSHGAVSVFAKGGAGKTFYGLYAIEHLTGRKVIFAPSRAILDQWRARVQAYLPSNVLSEIEFRTYQSLKTKPLTGEYTLAIYDEIQRMPADDGMRASQTNAICRIGLSATPWREDGNEDIIPALCGLPVGTDWETGAPADTIVWIVNDLAEKIDVIDRILEKPQRAKTMIFVYRLEIGDKIAKRTGLPFINGGTKKQFAEIAKHQAFVISNIGDAGISVDVSCVIEADYLGGRAQLGQRALRTAHASQKGELHLVMTRQEYNASARRLSALYALDFEIKVMGA